MAPKGGGDTASSRIIRKSLPDLSLPGKLKNNFIMLTIIQISCFFILDISISYLQRCVVGGGPDDYHSMTLAVGKQKKDRFKIFKDVSMFKLYNLNEI